MKKTAIIILAAIMAFSAGQVQASAADSKASTEQQNKKKKKGEVKNVTFNVYLHCDNCVKKVQENIAFEKGVKGLEVSLEDQTVAIKYDDAKTSEDVLKAAIEKLGYPVSGKLEPGQKAHEHDHGHDQDHGHEHHHHN